MTPQEQVKMLREALDAAAVSLECAACPDATRYAREALAATEPPKPYHVSSGAICGISREGTLVVQFYSTNPDERAAVLDALNALHEKEQAR